MTVVASVALLLSRRPFRQPFKSPVFLGPCRTTYSWIRSDPPAPPLPRNCTPPSLVTALRHLSTPQSASGFWIRKLSPMCASGLAFPRPRKMSFWMHTGRCDSACAVEASWFGARCPGFGLELKRHDYGHRASVFFRRQFTGECEEYFHGAKGAQGNGNGVSGSETWSAPDCGDVGLPS